MRSMVGGVRRGRGATIEIGLRTVPAFRLTSEHNRRLARAIRRKIPLNIIHPRAARIAPPGAVVYS